MSNEPTHNGTDDEKRKTEGSVEIKSVQVTYPLVLRHIFRLAVYEK